MAISILTVWEVETAGSDSNGGGFVAGASGTDKTYVAAGTSTPITRTDLTTGTTAANVTSAGTPFAASDVGNLIQITAGTGWTVGFYQVVSVTTAVATLDRAPAAASTGGGTGTLGGALATPKKAADNLVAGNRVWIKSGTYQALTTPVMNLAVAGVAISATQPPTWVSGYYSTRGDIGFGPKGANAANRPLLQLGATASTSISAMTCSTSNTIIENLVIDANGIGGCGGLGVSASSVTVRGCVAKNGNSPGNFGINGAVLLEYCEAYGGYAGAIVSAGSLVLVGSSIHDANYGVITYGTGGVEDCIFSGNGEAIFLNNGANNLRIARNTITANGNGIHNYAGTFGLSVKDNIFSSNTGTAFIVSPWTTFDDPAYDGNTFYGNAANFSNVASGGLTSLPYSHNYDVLAASDPVTSHASGTANFPTDNFGLVVGSGARSATWLSKFPGNTATASYADMGAVQSQATSSSGGGISGARAYGGF